MISIIVPVYNCEKYLKECVDSLTAQTYKNIEIILIDDGSKDNSPKICDELSENDKRIIVYHIKNGGASNARNVGLKNAKGNFIAFCDSDDKMKPIMLEKLLNGMIENNCDSAVCGYYKCDSNLKPLLSQISQDVIIQNTSQATKSVFFDKYYKDYQGYIWNRLFKKDVIDKNKIKYNTDVTLSEDKIFICQYLNVSGNVYYDTNPMYFYRNSVNSVTKQVNYDNSIKDEIYVYHYLMDNLHNLDKDVIKTIKGWNIRNCTSQLFTMKKTHYNNKELEKFIYKEFKQEKNIGQYSDFIHFKHVLFAGIYRIFH